MSSEEDRFGVGLILKVTCVGSFLNLNHSGGAFPVRKLIHKTSGVTSKAMENVSRQL